MKYLVLLIIAIVMLAAFNNRKCSHIYVAVMDAELKVQPTDEYCSTVYRPTTTRPEGQKIVCVKCFNVTRQKLLFSNK